jgi:hypothetical protein
LPLWTPEELWKGRSVFVIGGGPSLRSFNWSLLRDELTIGCNAAYRLGLDICKLCLFNDLKFWHVHREALLAYKGPVVTCAPTLLHSEISWLRTMRRQPVGLHVDALGWNKNTGAAALNLALILGAASVYLLGFDMKMSQDQKKNWHPYESKNTNNHTYQGFVQSFRHVVRDWEKKFPDREIVNVNDDSDLKGFPTVPVQEFFHQYKKAG